MPHVDRVVYLGVCCIQSVQLLTVRATTFNHSNAGNDDDDAHSMWNEDAYSGCARCCVNVRSTVELLHWAHVPAKL